MTLGEAAGKLKNQKVLVVTTKDEVSGRLREVGSDFVDVEYAPGKTALIPFSQIVTLKEQ
jgi:hypothetical protein